MKTKLIVFFSLFLFVSTVSANVRVPLSFISANPQARTEMLADIIDEQDSEIRMLQIKVSSMEQDIEHLRFLIKHLEASISKTKK